MRKLDDGPGLQLVILPKDPIAVHATLLHHLEGGPDPAGATGDEVVDDREAGWCSAWKGPQSVAARVAAVGSLTMSTSKPC